MHFSLPDGTHLASIIGGNFFGISKETTIHCVKIFNDEEGSVAGTDAAVDGINSVIEGVKKSGRPSIILIALNSRPVDSFDDAVCIIPVKCRRPRLRAGFFGGGFFFCNPIYRAKVTTYVTRTPCLH
jgi:hypothetical protein